MIKNNQKHQITTLEFNDDLMSPYNLLEEDKIVTKAYQSKQKDVKLSSIELWKVQKEGDCVRAILSDILRSITHDYECNNLEELKTKKDAISMDVLKSRLNKFAIIFPWLDDIQNNVVKDLLSTLQAENIPFSLFSHETVNLYSRGSHHQVQLNFTPGDIFLNPYVDDCIQFLNLLVNPSQTKYLVSLFSSRLFSFFPRVSPDFVLQSCCIGPYASAHSC